MINNYYSQSSGEIVYKESYRILKRKSCSNPSCKFCDVKGFDSGVDMWGVDFTDGIIPPSDPIDGAVYKMVVHTSVEFGSDFPDSEWCLEKVENRKMSYNGEDMIGDDGYGTWDTKRLDKEYRKLKVENERLKAQMDNHITRLETQLEHERKHRVEWNNEKLKLKAQLDRAMTAIKDGYETHMPDGWDEWKACEYYILEGE
jgi:hypothetical protein